MSHIEIEHRKKQAGVLLKHFGTKDEESKKITITDLFTIDPNKSISVDMIMSSVEPAENISVDKIMLIEKVLEVINKNK